MSSHTKFSKIFIKDCTLTLVLHMRSKKISIRSGCWTGTHFHNHYLRHVESTVLIKQAKLDEGLVENVSFTNGDLLVTSNVLVSKFWWMIDNIDMPNVVIGLEVYLSKTKVVLKNLAEETFYRSLEAYLIQSNCTKCKQWETGKWISSLK